MDHYEVLYEGTSSIVGMEQFYPSAVGDEHIPVLGMLSAASLLSMLLCEHESCTTSKEEPQ